MMQRMATEARSTTVPVPEPDLTREQMIERAKALYDMLQADQEEADRRGYYSEHLHEEFTKAAASPKLLSTGSATPDTSA